MEGVAIALVVVVVFVMLYLGGRGLDGLGRFGYGYASTLPVLRWFLSWRDGARPRAS
jgi:hypothetical protein